MVPKTVSPGRYSPVDPAVLGTTWPCPNQETGGAVRSAVVGDNSDLIEEVGRLWITPTDVVVDATFGRGAFWTKLPALPNFQFDRLTGHDLSALPLENETADVLALDPPYRPTHGSNGFTTNGLSKSYQLGNQDLDTIEDVLNLYRTGCKEAFRVLRSKGRIMVKCQDLSYGHRLHLVTLDVLRIMVDAGFELADQFILVGGTSLSSPKWNRQERARRNHSVLWVGVKP